VIDATDAMPIVEAVTTEDGQAGADTGVTADSAASPTDGGGAGPGTHRTED
jgi:hypothetical protein